jgi:hypothetical protein
MSFVREVTGASHLPNGVVDLVRTGVVQILSPAD